MGSNERHKIILQLINEHGAVTITELCERLQVSDMTIRRDLSALEGADLLRRIHGGAVSIRGRSYEPPFLTRTQESLEAKQAIAAFAVTLVNEGDSIALDVGTTTLEMAHCLTDKHNITVLTTSLPIANVLADRSDIRVILSGGILRPGELSLVGAIAEYTFSRFNLDKAFIGIGGIDLKTGLTEYNLEDAQIKVSLIRSAKQRILLADSSKFGRITFASVAQLSEIHQVITDEGLDHESRETLQQNGIELHIVKPSN